MKTLGITVFILVTTFFLGTNAQAQDTCDCTQDLAFIDIHIREMVSFKKQIKGSELDAYNNLYKKAVASSSKTTTVNDCFLLLNSLLAPIKDKHAQILHVKDTDKENDLDNEEARLEYRNSNSFKNFPKTNKDITGLTTQLQEKPYEAIEGIYKKREDLTIGIVKKGAIYQGIVLASKTKTWEIGQIKYTITEVAPNMYDVMTSDIPGGKMRFLRAALNYDGRIWHLKKDSDKEYTHTKDNQKPWEFKQINEDTQYVYFGTFSNKQENVDAFNTFYEENKAKFTAKNIIVDLRDNSGGNSKYSDPFHKIFKKNKMNVYVITNFFTGSNGEQFTLKLKDLKNTTHLGQRTYGAVAYGSNYGKLLKTPSGLFAIYPTDMNFHKLIEYEYVGVQPDIELDFNKDWIAQTLQIIDNNKL